MSNVILLKLEDGSCTVNFYNYIDKIGSRGYETDAIFSRDEQGMWTATMNFDGMSKQDTPEDAANKLSEYLLTMSKAVKGKNIKHLNIQTVFHTKNFK